MEKVTADRDALGEFAPQFAAFNDDILLGEVRLVRSSFPPKPRSIITVSALLASGILDSSLQLHMATEIYCG